MDRTTTGIFHAALLVSCSMNSVLQATDRAQGKPYMNPRDNTALLRLRLDYEQGRER